ncbi:MAG: hypothetical protein JO091_14535 [Acidobacteriaceae bacterium]|nr:hypothetical protein [Acidobacteriaceae bacterium]
MGHSRRIAILSVIGSVSVAAAAQDPQEDQNHRLPIPEIERDDKLPNGKSRKDAIAQQEHQQSLKDAEQLVTLSQQLKDELQKAGNYVVPLPTVKKTEEIEKLARRIRGRLKS